MKLIIIVSLLCISLANSKRWSMLNRRTIAFADSSVKSSTISKAYHAKISNSPVCSYFEVEIPTSKEGPPSQSISVEDLTPTIKSILSDSGMMNGSVTVISRHTTTALTINERESRLAKDMEKYFLALAPPDERSSANTAIKGVTYFHNDINKRPDSAEEAQRCRENGWDIDDPKELQKWRDQEPINAHSHLLSMLLGSSETIPVVNGEMVIGQVSYFHHSSIIFTVVDPLMSELFCPLFFY